MRAAVRTGFLGYTFSFVENHIKPPSVAGGDINSKVYIKVKAAGINPVDYKLPRLIGGKTIGIDFCGTIEEISGSNDAGKKIDAKYKVGDDVFGTCSTGSLAEYCVANTGNIAKVPTGWTCEECAALPVAYMSALQSLRIGKITYDIGNDNLSEEENKNKSVLVIGASGGCGIAGIQLCKSMGVGRIIAICSLKNTDFVKDLGATEVIPYDNDISMTNFFENNAGKLDCVYDAATGSGGGEDYWCISKKLLKKDADTGKCIGEYVALNGPANKWMRALSGTQKANESIIMIDSNSSDLELIITLLNRTRSKPVINKIPLTKDGIKDAFKLLKSRRTKGKIVFEV